MGSAMMESNDKVMDSKVMKTSKIKIEVEVAHREGVTNLAREGGPKKRVS